MIFALLLITKTNGFLAVPRRAGRTRLDRSKLSLAELAGGLPVHRDFPTAPAYNCHVLQHMVVLDQVEKIPRHLASILLHHSHHSGHRTHLQLLLVLQDDLDVVADRNYGCTDCQSYAWLTIELDYARTCD